jgi:hypothetical protein
VLLGAVEVFSNMDGFEIIHVLIDEFRNPDLRQIAMRLIADQPQW